MCEKDATTNLVYLCEKSVSFPPKLVWWIAPSAGTEFNFQTNFGSGFSIFFNAVSPLNVT